MTFILGLKVVAKGFRLTLVSVCVMCPGWHVDGGVVILEPRVHVW